MKRKLKKNIHRLKHSVSQRGISAIAKRRSLKGLAEKLGMVYFGAVSQHVDDHSITRGFSASATHFDDNYSVGSLEGYDVSFVQRTDFLESSDGEIQIANWFILEIDLQNAHEMPHFLLRAKSGADNFDLFFRSNPDHRQVIFGHVNHPGHDFSSRYDLFTKPTSSIAIETLFDHELTKHGSAHLWPLSAEANNNKLYVYYSADSIDKTSCEHTIRSGLWLAKTLDQKSSLLSE
jgi:hypothetical protein